MFFFIIYELNDNYTKIESFESKDDALFFIKEMMRIIVRLKFHPSDWI